MRPSADDNDSSLNDTTTRRSTRRRRKNTNPVKKVLQSSRQTPEAAAGVQISTGNLATEILSTRSDPASDGTAPTPQSDAIRRKVVPPTKPITKVPKEARKLQHQVARGRVKLYRCEHCPYQNRCRTRYHVHLAKHDATIHVYRCQVCQQPFRTAAALEKHITKRHMVSITTYSCAVCPFQTSNYQHYDRHNRKVHRLNSKGDPVPTLRCSECDYTCLFASELAYHVVRHSAKKPFTCDRCPYASVRRGDVVKHVLIAHDAVRTHICETCGYTTYTSAKLAIHSRTHTKLKPYNCQTCHKSYADASTFKRHCRTHLKASAFDCPVCGRTYKRRHLMVEHLWRQHQVTEEDAKRDGSDGKADETQSSFQCAICTETFKAWKSLNVHLQKAHQTNLQQ